MATRRLLLTHNSEDLHILRTPCRPVKLPNLKLKQLLADMFETMHTAHGIGLAAPQIGLSIRVAVIEIAPTYTTLEDGDQQQLTPHYKYALINPKVVKYSQTLVEEVEGCLSIRGIAGLVRRSRSVTVEYQDVSGKTLRIQKATGTLARALQHEIDHLNGILFVDHIDDLKKLFKKPTAPGADVISTLG